MKGDDGGRWRGGPGAGHSIDRREGELSRGLAGGVLQGGAAGGVRTVVRGGGHHGAAELREEHAAESPIRDEVPGDGRAGGAQPDHQGRVAATSVRDDAVHAGDGPGRYRRAGARRGRHGVRETERVVLPRRGRYCVDQYLVS